MNGLLSFLGYSDRLETHCCMKTLVKWIFHNMGPLINSHTVDISIIVLDCLGIPRSDPCFTALE